MIILGTQNHDTTWHVWL